MSVSWLYYILIVLIHILISNHTYAETESSTDLPCRYVTTLSVGSASDENRSLFFDHQGLLWVGTNSGLKSFDGYEVRVFKSTAASPSLLPNNTVVSIGEDGNGNSVYVCLTFTKVHFLQNSFAKIHRRPLWHCLRFVILDHWVAFPKQ